jgi:hypothetical protein
MGGAKNYTQRADSMGKGSRVELTNMVIDAALAATGQNVSYSRDVPNGFVSATFPDRMGRDGNLNPVDGGGKLLITPAKESKAGRGQVFFDVHGIFDGLEIGISLKVSDYIGDDHAPRNSIISGSKAEHYFGMHLAAQRGTLLPVIQFWQDASGQWWRCAFDAGRILRERRPNLTVGWDKLLHSEIPNMAACGQLDRLEAITGERPPIVALGEGGAIAISPLVRGRGKYCYLSAKISHARTGHGWTPVDAPRLPESYGELLEWTGEQGEMIG